MGKHLAGRLVMAALLSATFLSTPPMVGTADAFGLKKGVVRTLKKVDRGVRRGVKKITKAPIVPIVGAVVVGAIAANAFDSNACPNSSDGVHSHTEADVQAQFVVAAQLEEFVF